MNNKVPLDIYDGMPESMQKYIANYGWHFNKKCYDYAVSKMYKKSKNSDTSEPITAYTKEEVNDILSKYSIKLENKIMYDYVFVATMCKADYYGKSVPDEKHLAMYVKDTIDDYDASTETTFRRWVATMVGNGEPIDWTELC